MYPNYFLPWLVRATNQSKYVRINSAKFRREIRNIQKVIAWSERFKLIEEFPIIREFSGIKGLMAMLFHELTGNHLYAIS